MKYFCEACGDYTVTDHDLSESEGMLDCAHCGIPLYWYATHPDPGYGGTRMWAHLGNYMIDGDVCDARLWRRTNRKWRVVGSTHIDRRNNHIIAMIDAPFDEATGSDVTVVYDRDRGDPRNNLRAIIALWDSRHDAL